MAVKSIRRYGLTESPVIQTELRHLSIEHPVLAKLGGEELLPNRGVPLNLDWVENVRVNTSAVERRAQTLGTRRTVKKD